MKKIIAIVGMPGAGKTEASSYLLQKGFPFFRFGQITIDELKAKGLPITQENERVFREDIRKREGMGAYAVRALPHIKEMLQKNSLVVIDGLYSWEEYKFLEEKSPGVISLVVIYAEPAVRYKRLKQRVERGLDFAEARARDIAELENLNKGGPIAIADFLIENNDTIEKFHKKIDAFLQRLKSVAT